jgi:hypothetical protein
VRVVDVRAIRPSTATVSVTVRTSSLTFWWMRLLPKRVSDDVPTTADATASPRSPTRASARSHTSVATSGEAASLASTTIRRP